MKWISTTPKWNNLQWYDSFIFQEALSKINRKPAAGYMLQSQYFYLSWGESSNRSDLILQRFIQREGEAPRLDNMKNIYTPQRVALGEVDIHVIGPATGYKMYVCVGLCHTKYGLLQAKKSLRTPSFMYSAVLKDSVSGQ